MPAGLHSLGQAPSTIEAERRRAEDKAKAQQLRDEAKARRDEHKRVTDEMNAQNAAEFQRQEAARKESARRRELIETEARKRAEKMTVDELVQQRAEEIIAEQDLDRFTAVP